MHTEVFVNVQSAVPSGVLLRTYSQANNYNHAASTRLSTATAERTDSVEISDDARSISGLREHGLVRELFPGLNVSNGISPTDLSGLLREKTAGLRRELDEAFSRAGIDNSEEVVLTVGYDGSILVKGEHPEKERIEAMFRGDSGLGNRFREVSALASVARVGRETLEFQQAYAADPKAAVNRYAHLFNENYKPEFHLSYSADKLGIYFTDLFHYGCQTLEY